MVYHSIYGERVRYRINTSTSLRQKFSRSCREKYIFPVIVTELLGNDGVLSKDIELPIEGHITLANLNSYLRQKFKLGYNEGILIYSESKNEKLILPPLSKTIELLYKENMNEVDRNLYIIIQKQEMYG